MLTICGIEIPDGCPQACLEVYFAAKAIFFYPIADQIALCRMQRGMTCTSVDGSMMRISGGWEGVGMLGSIAMIMDKVNVPSVDDGERFVVADRVNGIASLLSGSKYRALKSDGLSHIYALPGFDLTGSVILLSCHVDSMYKHHWYKAADDAWIGTFDNSISTAVVIDLMLRASLPQQLLIAFTGDEEHDLGGADDVMAFVEEGLPESRGVDLAVVVDITSEGYGEYDFTMENVFYGEKSEGEDLLAFNNRGEMEGLLRSIFDEDVLLIPDAATDESWEYDEWGVNAVSLCIPTAPPEHRKAESPGVWMHSDDGILVKKESIVGFSRALVRLCGEVAKYVAKPAMN